MGKTLRITLLAIAAICAIVSLYIYNTYIVGSNVPRELKEEYIHIPTGSTFEEVVQLLVNEAFLLDEASFRVFAEQMAYNKNPMRSGRFQIKPGWSNVDLIRHLRNGKQAPVDVVLTNERLPENVAAKAARFIEPDSLAIWTLLQDQTYLESIGHTPESLISIFIPNTYEFFWNTSAKGFVNRMLKENKAFWGKENRAEKAEKLGLTRTEVYTLASIIERETQQNSEKQRMAGVYYNRLQKGMLLQADPTSVFARRDFYTKRVTDYHTKFDNPYNTYVYKGLPPGPICMASIASLDAVLNVEDHDYVYFCAKGDGSGLHNFAKTLAAHNRNAKIYRQNLKKRGLR